jgi:dihydrofolate reductase
MSNLRRPQALPEKQIRSISGRSYHVGKLTVLEYLTLDGVMEAPETWQFPYLSDDVMDDVRAGLHQLEGLLLGRVTYEIFAAHWPLQTNNEFGVADKLNSVPKFVVSSTLEKAEWNNSTLIREDPTGAISALKQQAGGMIGIVGSAALVQSLMQAGLIDEYRLLVHPVIVGSGKRLFHDGMNTTALRLVESRAYRAGVVRLTYQPDQNETAPM